MTDEKESTRPTPVRAGAAPPRPARDVPAEAVSEPPPQARDFTDAEGRGWRVEVAGRGRTGLRGVPRADLILLIFRRAQPEPSVPPPPSGGASEPEALEALAAASDLDALTDEQLAALLADARPLRAEAKGDASPPGSGRPPPTALSTVLIVSFRHVRRVESTTARPSGFTESHVLIEDSVVARVVLR